MIVVYDVVTALQVRIDTYERLIARLRIQSFDASETGDSCSSQFYKGQYFALGFVVSDLRDVLIRLESSQD